jgi:hypothetical protein
MRNYNFIAKIAISAAFCFAAAAIPAQTPTGAEIMSRVFHPAMPKTSIATLSMVITKNGRSLSRALILYSTGDSAKGETKKTLMKFLAPGDVKGSGFLSLKKPDGSTESLLWLPAMGKVRRLSSGKSDQDSAFFGSDFSNRDINGFVEDDFTYELEGIADGAYAVEAMPRKEMGYDKLVYLIDADSFRSERIEYYRAGKIVKSQNATYAQVQGYFEPDTIAMSSASGSSTSLKFSDYRLDTALGDQVFTERFLRQ